MIEYSDNFLKEVKSLYKKYKLIKNDLKILIKELEDGKLGTNLGHGLYKKRVKNSSIPTGKSGGFRVIILKKIENRLILLSIYSKSDISTLSDDELKVLVENYFKKR